MHLFNSLLILFIVSGFSLAVSPAVAVGSAGDDKPEIVLGINTADVREDTSSVQFLNLFRSAIPFSETVPWGSSKKVEYDVHGWPSNLNGGQAGTKFLNRLPENTVEDGFFTVLYDGEGEIFYGNDARLVVHRPNKDIIEIRSGKDRILNASLFVKKSNPENYLRNIRILPEGGICKGRPHFRVKSPEDCGSGEYLSFEDNHLNPWANEQREKQKELTAKEDKTAEVGKTESAATEPEKEQKDSDEKSNEKVTKKTELVSVEPASVEDKDKSKQKSIEEAANETPSKTAVTDIDKPTEKDEPETNKEAVATDEKQESKDQFVIKGQSKPAEALLFNPEYLDFMKDFQVVRFMNMSGMTRNPVKEWDKRNTLKKATWGGKYGSRGAPVEIMVALSNEINAHAWFSMPYKSSDDYIQKFGEYVNANLESDLKAYIEYSNEVWNPIFSHHDYAIAQGKKARLDKRKSHAGYKWYSKRSVETFKIWEKVFGGTERLVRVMGSWASNQKMSSTILSYKDAYKHTDAVAIGPYFSAHPRVLRRAKTVDDVFKAMLDKTTKWGMRSTVNYIKKQAKVAKSYGVDLVAYEGGQHLVDWNTRNADEHPNKLLYAANRDPRMGILYDELMREWHRAGGKLFVAFSAPRIYSWYGSWGIKEYIRQPRSEAPKYDSLLRYLNTRLYPEQLPKPGVNPKELASMSGEVADIPIAYAKGPQLIWDMSQPQMLQSNLKDNNPRDFSASWQANWDSKNLYVSFAITDDDVQSGDEVTLTLDTTSEADVAEKALEQEKTDIKVEKELLEKKKKEKEARRIRYEEIAKAKKDKEDAEKKAEKETEKEIVEKSTNKALKNSKLEITSKVDTQEKTDKEETKNDSTVEITTKANEVLTSNDKVDGPDSKKPDKDETDEKKSEKLVIEDKQEQTKENDKELTEKVVEKDVETESKSDGKPLSKSVSESVSESIDDQQKAIEKEFKQALKSEMGKENIDSKENLTPKENKDAKERKLTENVKPEDKTEKKSEPDDSLLKKQAKENDKAVLAEKIKDGDSKEDKTLEDESHNENVQTFTFAPFDEVNSQSRITITDTGYLLNIALPWSEIYKNQEDATAKTGSKLGINIVVTDSDKDEKGNKELHSADTSISLPKIVLKNSLAQ